MVQYRKTLSCRKETSYEPMVGKRFTEGSDWLQRLATHTSGFPGNPSNLHLDWHDPYAKYLPARLHAYLSQYEEKSSVTSTHPYLYSNLGFGILGYALGQKLGVSYQQAILNRICEPLDMLETCFTLTEEQHQRLATPYTIKGERASNWDFLPLRERARSVPMSTICSGFSRPISGKSPLHYDRRWIFANSFRFLNLFRKALCSALP